MKLVLGRLTSKSYAPTSRAESGAGLTLLRHSLFRVNCVLSADHLHESVASGGIHNACLNLAKLGENLLQFILVDGNSSDEECTAKN